MHQRNDLKSHQTTFEMYVEKIISNILTTDGDELEETLD